MKRTCRQWLAALIAVAAFAAAALAVNVRDFHKDGETDWSSAIQEAHDSLKDPKTGYPDMSGGELFFPCGEYPISNPVILRLGNLTLRGEGGKWNDTKTTWLRNTGDGPMFVFPHDESKPNGFRCQDMLIEGNRKNCGFRIWTGTAGFRRDFTWDRVGFFYLRKAIETQRDGGQRSVGNLKLFECVASQNAQVLAAREGLKDATPGWSSEKAVEARIITLTIRDCEIRQNTPLHVPDVAAQDERYVLDLGGARCVRIRDNCLEGQWNVIRIYGGRVLILDGNYFEGHPGPILDAIATGKIALRDNLYEVLGVDKGGINKFRFDRCNRVTWGVWNREWYDFRNSILVIPNPTMR